MRKTFALNVEGKHPDRVVDAVKHDIRKYVRRERRRDLPQGSDFWDFDCRFGPDAEHAEAAHLSALTGLVDAVAQAQGTQCYVEILAKPAVRRARPAGEDPQAGDVAEAGAAANAGAGDSAD